jgi:glycerol-3-phosphate acyltransferase PlsY
MLFDNLLIILVFSACLAYLIGSISGALIVSNLMNLQDPRTFGSGNPGATNVLRSSGKKAAIMTLGIDVFKGMLAVLIAQFWSDDAMVLAGVTLAVFLGHLYPIFFQFRGGKGVATAFGALLVLAWQVGLAVLATWLFIAILFRYSSLAAISAAILTPAYLFWFLPGWEYLVMSFIMSGLLIWRHRSNIHNLLTGREDKIDEKA